ncbi:MAG: polysaccharide deacetylase family protein [Ktedonobacteraceae bacterium]|nr:polysaccharide deacetylase family protein [Ktedonobacteraceae bacterium]
MLHRILTLIAAGFYYSGLIRLARWWLERSGPHLVILNYHRASGGDLRRQMLYLRKHYRVLHLEEALKMLYMPDPSASHQGDRRTPLVMTFDDGYHDYFSYGAALAKELQVPITVFLVPGYIERGGRFWWDEGAHLVADAQVKAATVEGRTYHLDNASERQELSQVIDRRARCAASVSEREEFLAMMRQLLKVPVPVHLEEKPATPLSWEEVEALKENEWVSIGAHTMNHPTLSCLTDIDELRYEIKQCRAVLEQRLGRAVRTFAYPIGKFEHIGSLVPRLAKEAGYDCALTTEDGLNTPRTDPYLMRRVVVDVDQHWMMVAAKACGLWGLIFGPWRKFARLIRKESIKQGIMTDIPLSQSV